MSKKVFRSLFFVAILVGVATSYYVGKSGIEVTSSNGSTTTSVTSIVSPSNAYTNPVTQKTSGTSAARFSSHPYSGDYTGIVIPKDGISLTKQERVNLIKNGHPHWGSSLIKIPDVDINDVSIKGAFDKFVLDLLSLEKYTGALSEKMESSSIYAIKGFDISETERVTRKIYQNIHIASIKSNSGDLAHNRLDGRIDGVKGLTDSLWDSHHGVGPIAVSMSLDKTGKTMKLRYLDGTKIDFKFMPASGTLSGKQVKRTTKVYAIINSIDPMSYSILVNADVMASSLVNGSRVIMLSPFQVNLTKKGAMFYLTKSPFGMTRNEAKELLEPLN